MRIKKIRIMVAGLVIFVVAVLISVLSPISRVFAERFTGNYQACLNQSGGHDGIYSVANYACPIASSSTQSVCATWLGPTYSSTSTTVYASTASGTVPLRFYGMCTDRTDTTSSLYLVGDNGSIGGFSTNFTRTNNWGSPSSMGATLDVAKFIEGLSPIIEDGNLVYSRMIRVVRSHSDANSTGLDFSLIKLVIGECGEECDEIPDPPDFCDRHAPTSYLSSTETNGTTSIEVYIRNADIRFGKKGMGKFSTANTPIYAMPTDTIEWKTCYYPGVQKTAFTKVSDLNGEKKGYDELSSTVCQSPLSVRDEELYIKSGIWDNYYRVSGAAGDGREDFPVGQWKPTGMWDNSYTTKLLDSGNTFTEYGETGSPTVATITDRNPTQNVYDWRWGCTGRDEEGGCTSYGWIEYVKCVNSYSSTIHSATVDYTQATDNESVKVPYNFKNYTGVTLAKDVAFSGEKVKIGNVWTTVTPRTNNTTKATYATVVPKAKLRLFAYVTTDPGSFSGNVTSNSGSGCVDVIGSGIAKQCLRIGSQTELTLNPSGNLAGGTDNFWLNQDFNAFDAAAGDYLCFVSAVYPAASGSDTQMGVNGNEKWRYSTPSCMTIAKRPTFQVWGGDMYSVNAINAFVGEKKNIYNDYYVAWHTMPTFAKTGGTTTYFGSWVEEGLVMRDDITQTVFSGASTGKDSNAARAGSTGNFCNKRTPLSFANYLDAENSVICPQGEAAGNSKIPSDISDREDILKYWIGNNVGPANVAAGSTISLTDQYNVGTETISATGATIKYVNVAGGLTISDSTVEKGVTYLIRSDKKVTITGDIKYRSNNYTSINQIPKVIIYAKNVDIMCNVKEIDAIIITDPDADGNGGKVNTCADATEPEDYAGDNENQYQTNRQQKLAAWNDVKRSNPLKISGAVITDEIYMGRTYGAAAWDPSRYTDATDGVAAEIFDYDSTLLMWSEFMSGSAETDTLNTVYQHELAPRY